MIRGAAVLLNKQRSTDSHGDPSPRPRFIQIANEIRELIAAGALKEHDILPSERSLSEKYEVSRMTGRRALEALETAQGTVATARASVGAFQQTLNFSAATIDTALFLLRETASNLTIADSAVQAEIPVVTAEYEARNNIYMEAYKASMQNWTKGLTYIDRFPIGTLASINGLTADAVKAFYAQHYYPANTQLIIAGDVHAPEILAKINATFADWDKANLDTGFIAGNLEVNEQVQVASFTGANIPTQVNLYYVTAQTKQADTVLTRRSEYVEQIANSTTFAEHFFEHAANHLRKGGIFTYLSNEIDSLSRSHQRILFKHFDSIELSMVSNLNLPQQVKDQWWTDSMVIVKATK